MTIRLAVDEDFSTIYSIWLEGINNSFDLNQKNPEDLFQKFYSNFSTRRDIFNFWVAVDQDGKIQGWQSLLETSNNPFRENKWAESSTYISINNRFKGLGKSLLEHVLREAENSQLEYVVGFVSITNEAARKITSETGWVEVGILPSAKQCDSTFQKYFLVRPV